MEIPIAPDELTRLRSHVIADLPAYIGDLERLVNVDCGSYTKAGVDEVGRWVADALRAMGALVTLDHNTDLGNTVIGELAGAAGGPVVLLIGHMDTVFDPGTAAERPFRVEGGRAYGPGVTDMKSGLLAGIYALRALRRLAGATSPAVDWLPVGRLVFVANPDEEIGSPMSTPVIRRLAAEADVALVLECARANGDIVSSRKGIVDLELRIAGRSAHAGIEPEEGRSAVLEAAHKVIALQAMNGRWPGVTVNVGVVRGGTRPNVVAESALLQVDLRAVERSALDEAEAAIRTVAATAVVSDTATDVVELGRHWPMEKLKRSGHLVGLSVAIATALGFRLRDAPTGGASDANTTAGMGVPTIDGLGPIGGGDHSPVEYLELDSIVPRTTMLAALVLAVGRDPAIRQWRPEPIGTVVSRRG
jgi:glutamate carboxypeptidase